jgi:predicted GIY-YIG superfamily endonuclease
MHNKETQITTQLFTVYGLFNTDTNEFEYIGCSKNPNKRLAGHIKTKPIPGYTGFGLFYGRENLELINIHSFENRKEAFQYEGYIKGLLGMTWSEQAQGERLGKTGKGAQAVKELCSKPVLCYKKDTNEFVNQFESQIEAARQLGLNVGNIRHVISGKYKHTGGYTFKEAV